MFIFKNGMPVFYVDLRAKITYVFTKEFFNYALWVNLAMGKTLIQ